MEFGIDISVYQKKIDLTQALAEGVTFAIIKAGGADCGKYKDSYFEYHYQNCAAHSIPVGSYFFGKCNTVEQAIEEAKYYLSIIKDKIFPLKCWYDIEASMCSLPKERLNAIAKAFCATVSEAGYECGVYASLSTFNKIDYDGSFSSTYPKWIAYWGKSKPNAVREGKDIWQFGGESNMIRSNKVGRVTCDCDYCYFTFEKTAPALNKPMVALYTLRYGNRGEAVRELQEDLNYLFKSGLVLDGSFGSKTKKALIEAQKVFFPEESKEWDGVYGPKTYNKMIERMKAHED